MRDIYEMQLSELDQKMQQMSRMIEEAIEQSVHALENLDTETAKKIMEEDALIDRKEKEIESLCLKLLLRQNPVAGDFRKVSSALKMITDMERIGDHAADISEITILLAKEYRTLPTHNMSRMAEETMKMVRESIDAFVSQDAELARKVIDYDDVVDNLFLEEKAELINLVYRKEPAGEAVADLLMAAKYFERIGDHATNIAEWVLYSLTGEH